MIPFVQTLTGSNNSSLQRANGGAGGRGGVRFLHRLLYRMAVAAAAAKEAHKFPYANRGRPGVYFRNVYTLFFYEFYFLFHMSLSICVDDDFRHSSLHRTSTTPSSAFSQYQPVPFILPAPDCHFCSPVPL